MNCARAPLDVGASADDPSRRHGAASGYGDRTLRPGEIGAHSFPDEASDSDVKSLRSRWFSGERVRPAGDAISQAPWDGGPSGRLDSKPMIEWVVAPLFKQSFVAVTGSRNQLARLVSIGG